MAKDRVLSSGRTAAEEADYQATGKKPMWQRAGMTREEWERGQAQREAELNRYRAQTTDHHN